MKKAVAFTTSTPSCLAIRIFMVLSVILLYLLPLAVAGRMLSSRDMQLRGLSFLAGQAVARNLGNVGGSPIRGDGSGSHHGN